MTESPKTPSLDFVRQYFKDVSFENPRPLVSADLEKSKTHVNIEVVVTHVHDQGTQAFFEITLKTQVRLSDADDTSLYLCELDYAGVFGLKNVTDTEMRNLIVFVECPRLLFPFVRQHIAYLVQESGYPPVFLNPVDFHGLFAQRTEGLSESEKESLISKA